MYHHLCALKFTNFKYTLFNSLGDNEVGDAGATALADALRVSQSLKILRLVHSKVLNTIGWYHRV